MSDALRCLAATLPAGRESAIRIEERREGGGFPVWSLGIRIGRLRWSSEPRQGVPAWRAGGLGIFGRP